METRKHRRPKGKNAPSFGPNDTFKGRKAKFFWKVASEKTHHFFELRTVNSSRLVKIRFRYSLDDFLNHELSNRKAQKEFGSSAPFRRPRAPRTPRSRSTPGNAAMGRRKDLSSSATAEAAKRGEGDTSYCLVRAPRVDSLGGFSHATRFWHAPASRGCRRVRRNASRIATPSARTRVRDSLTVRMRAGA